MDHHRPLSILYLSFTYPLAIRYLSFCDPNLLYPFSVFSLKILSLRKNARQRERESLRVYVASLSYSATNYCMMMDLRISIETLQILQWMTEWFISIIQLIGINWLILQAFYSRDFTLSVVCLSIYLLRFN